MPNAVLNSYFCLQTAILAPTAILALVRPPRKQLLPYVNTYHTRRTADTSRYNLEQQVLTSTGNSFDHKSINIVQDEPPLHSGIQECKPDGPPNFVSDENIPDCLRKTEEKI
jgi:hypothetical protein